MSTPRSDYFDYVNGEWCRNTPIPDDFARWGAFNILSLENQKKLRELCETNNGHIGWLYSKSMNLPSTVPQPVLDLVELVRAQVKDVPSYLATAGYLFTRGVGTLFHICKGPDDKNPTLNAPNLFQAGLGLPDMAYYTERPDLATHYKEFLTTLCAQYGFTIDADAVYDFETKKAALHLTKQQCRDPIATYNKLDAATVTAYLPEYFGALGLPSTMNYYLVQNVRLLSELRTLLESVGSQTLRDHLLVRIAIQFAQSSTYELGNTYFDFYNRRLNGQKKRPERWRESVGFISSFLRDELGALYVQKHYPASKSAACREMINDLVVALHGAITESSWMTTDTKTQALEKLARFGVKVGEPEDTVSTTDLWPCIDGNESTAEFIIKWATWDWQTHECAKFYTPVNTKLWEMGAFEVNAYFHPTLNQIVFPAGILQFPFFGFDTYEENVGAIGVVIGHEMSHGYDDQGSQYNPAGELKEWWSETDRVEYEKRAGVVEQHYGSLTFRGKPVNGKLTLGENIADIGGLKLALRALNIHYEAEGKEVTQEVYDRFFRAYAGVWRQNITDELAHQFLVVDPHSPCYWRVNAALGHIPEFTKTYDVVEGDAMYLAPEKRMQIW